MFWIANTTILFCRLHMKKINESEKLRDEFTCALKMFLPSVVLDADSEQAITTIYEELSRKLCNTRIQEFFFCKETRLCC